MDGLAHPEYLISPAELQGTLAAPGLVIVDLDSPAGYHRGHIPGAAHLADSYERNPATGWVNTLPPERFAAVCQDLGIGADTAVVAYDNNLSLYAARFWWTLRYYGHQKARVLNGGWRAWIAAGGPVSFAPPPSVAAAAGPFIPKIDPSLGAGLAEVQAACNLDDAVVWDTRSAGEFSGAVNRGNRRAGHIAGAIHLDWLDLMERDTHQFKPAAELRALLNARGITSDKAVFAY